jgi:hypothetical protein
MILYNQVGNVFVKTHYQKKCCARFETCVAIELLYIVAGYIACAVAIRAI